MNLDKDELIALRKDGTLSNTEFYRLVKDLMVESDVEGEEVIGDPMAPVLEAIKEIKVPPESRDDSALIGLLQDLKMSIDKFTLSMKDNTLQRKKKKELVPVYQDGKIIKITIV